MAAALGTTSTSISTATTISTTTLPQWDMMEADRAANCVDIKEYLWKTTFDLTSLTSTMSIFAVLYTLIVTLGVLGNSLVVLSVIRHRSLQSVRNIFIVSLSCSDIVASIVSGTITPITAFTKIWLFGAPLCKLVPVIQGSALCFSTLTLMAISIDRFILIIYPTRRAIQKRHALQMIAGNATLAIAISAPMFFKQALVDYMGFCGQFCAEDWGGEEQAGRSTYGTIVFFLQFVIPFVVITFCYLMISLRLNKGMTLKGGSDSITTQPPLHSSSNALISSAAYIVAARNSKNKRITKERRSSSSTSQPLIQLNQKKFSNQSATQEQLRSTAPKVPIQQYQSEQRRQALKRRLRTNRMLMAMVAVFACCWTPSVVFNFLRDYQWLPVAIAAQGYLVGIITHCISMTSTVWNPVLYALLNEQFRLAFVELFNDIRQVWFTVVGGRGADGTLASIRTASSRLAAAGQDPYGSRVVSHDANSMMVLNGMDEEGRIMGGDWSEPYKPFAAVCKDNTPGRQPTTNWSLPDVSSTKLGGQKVNATSVDRGDNDKAGVINMATPEEISEILLENEDKKAESEESTVRLLGGGSANANESEQDEGVEEMADGEEIFKESEDEQV